MAERQLAAAAWRGYARADFPADAWSIDGSVLQALAGGPQIDLITRDTFADFVLSFEWRLPRGGSSAVVSRVGAESAPATHSGPALQLLDDARHRDGADAVTSCGALYGVMAPWHELRDSAHVFHSARLVLHGTRLEHWIDDQQVLGCDLASADLQARIARSRFHDCPQYARLSSGHIVLQHRGTQVWFRGLRVGPP